MKTADVNTEPKELDFTSVLAVASGSGLIGGSILGLGGALIGAIAGAGFGYWAQASGSDHPRAARKRTGTDTKSVVR